MSIFNHPNFLRAVLTVDAVTCVAMGALMTLGSAPLAETTELPQALVFYAGLSLFPIGAFIALVAARRLPVVAGAWLVIIGNAGWVIGSVLLLLGSNLAPNALGIGFVLMQAVAVAALAELEVMGVRREVATA